ncbi:hypothetical protein YC2023_065776 [Brassica napus]
MDQLEQKRQKTVQFGDFHTEQSEVIVPDQAEQPEKTPPVTRNNVLLWSREPDPDLHCDSGRDYAVETKPIEEEVPEKGTISHRQQRMTAKPLLQKDPHITQGPHGEDSHTTTTFFSNVENNKLPDLR